MARLVAALKALGNVQYDLELPVTLEPGSYLDIYLISALQAAGWQLQSIAGNVEKRPLDPFLTMMSPPPYCRESTSKCQIPTIMVGVSRDVEGIRFLYDPFNPTPPEMSKVAYAAAKAFRSIDLAAEAMQVVFTRGESPYIAHIVVGEKP